MKNLDRRRILDYVRINMGNRKSDIYDSEVVQPEAKATVFFCVVKLLVFETVL
jgi:hypothetical protein